MGHRLLSILITIDRYLRVILRWSIIALMVSMTIIVFLQVVFRYLLDAPLGWSEELARFLFVWVSFLGAANLVRLGQHVSVKTFVQIFPPLIKNVSEVIGHLIVIFCSVMFFIGGIGITTKEWIQLSPALQIEMGWIYTVIPVATMLMIIWAAVDLIATVVEMRKGLNK